ncbi:MAG TPA: TonB C-terminal domain-containing protein [Thermoanaerobaculia bacterium]|nr:TonB C-terminal domain-containing protein [Thermoanaerobaculia bacterium]
MDTVGEILAQRSEHDPLWKAGAVGTLLLHAGVGAALLIASRLPTRRMFISPQAVAVRLVSLQSVRGSRAEAEQPVSRPVIEKAQDVPEPSPKAMPLPEEKKSKKEPPPPVHPSKTSPQAKTKASGSAVDLPQPGESAEGSPTGVAGAGSTFGTSLSAFDSADFNYSYYVSRMLATIGANWFKPTDQAVSPPVIFFRIGRDGTISDVQIERTSGLPFVDRAAQRAVMVSSPLPPLPADFHESSLGVHLRFQ